MPTRNVSRLFCVNRSIAPASGVDEVLKLDDDYKRMQLALWFWVFAVYAPTSRSVSPQPQRGVNSISFGWFGSPRVRCTPMWSLSTCGARPPNEIKKNTHPKEFTFVFLRRQVCGRGGPDDV